MSSPQQLLPSQLRVVPAVRSSLTQRAVLPTAAAATLTAAGGKPSLHLSRLTQRAMNSRASPPPRGPSHWQCGTLSAAGLGITEPQLATVATVHAQAMQELLLQTEEPAHQRLNRPAALA